MIRKMAVLALIALPLAVCGCSHPQAAVPGPPPPPPPAVFSAVAQQGYHDGVNAAVADMRHRKQADARRHLAFRKPPVARDAWSDYRKGFRAGYNAVYRGGPAAGPAGDDE